MIFLWQALLIFLAFGSWWSVVPLLELLTDCWGRKLRGAEKGRWKQWGTSRPEIWTFRCWMFSFCWNLLVIAELLYRLYRCGSLLQVKASKFYNQVLDKALIFPFSLLTDVLGWFWAPSGSCISLKQQNCLFCVNWIAGTHSLLDFSSPSRKWLCWLVMVFWYCWTSSLWAAASMGVLRSQLVLCFEGKKKATTTNKKPNAGIEISCFASAFCDSSSCSSCLTSTVSDTHECKCSSPKCLGACSVCRMSSPQQSSKIWLGCT